MSLDRFRLLHLRRVRRNRLRTLASMLGIAAGVALVVAMSSLLSSSTATARSSVGLLGGARYEVLTPPGDRDRVASALEATPSVSSIRAYVEQPVLAGGNLAWLVAIDPTGPSLDSPEARALAQTVGARTGSALPHQGTLTITGASGLPQRVAIAGPADQRLLDRFGGRVVAADLATAQRIQGDAGATRLLVYGDVSLDTVRRAAGDTADVNAVEDRVAQARNTMQLMFSSLSVLGAMGLVVGSFLVFNTMNMAVLERRDEIASLRALGSDRRSIWSGVLGEASLLGASGSLIGVGLGVGMARAVVGSVPDAFARTVGSPLAISLPITNLAAAWLLGLVIALAAAIAPARRALRVEPIEALRPDVSPSADGRVAVHPPALALGAGLTAIAAFLPGDIVPAPTAMGAGFVGLLAITYGCAPAIVRLARGVALRFGATGELAAGSLARAPRRVWATTASVVVAIAVAVTTTGLAINLRDTLIGDLRTATNSEFWIGTTTGDTIALTGLPPSWTEELAAVPGVAAIAGSTWLRERSGAHFVGIQGVHGDSSYPFSRLADVEARAQMAAGRGAIVLRQYASTFDRHVGDVIALPGATPPLLLPIVAITDAVSPASGGMINISFDLLARHYHVDAISRYEVQLEPGAEAPAVRAQLEAIIARSALPVRIDTGAQFLAALSASTDQVLALVAMVLVVIVTCAGIAVLNTLLASVLERTGELAVLRAVGATRRRLVRSIACEAAAIGITGGLLGAAAGTVLHAVVVRRVHELTLLHVDYAFSPPTVALALVAGLTIALIGAVLPARRAARLDLLDALNA